MCWRPAREAGRFLFRRLPAPRGHDSQGPSAYIRVMRSLYVLVPLFALLVAAFWLAGATWERLAGDPIPLYGWIAVAGGVFFSLLVGGGLMALIFYSSRHGYDDLSGGDGQSQ